MAGDGSKSALLLGLRPLLDFQRSFKERHGRRAAEEEHPDELHGLLELFKSRKHELLQGKQAPVRKSPRRTPPGSRARAKTPPGGPVPFSALLRHSVSKAPPRSPSARPSLPAGSGVRPPPRSPVAPQRPLLGAAAAAGSPSSVAGSPSPRDPAHFRGGSGLCPLLSPTRVRSPLLGPAAAAAFGRGSGPRSPTASRSPLLLRAGGLSARAQRWSPPSSRPPLLLAPDVGAPTQTAKSPGGRRNRASATPPAPHLPASAPQASPTCHTTPARKRSPSSPTVLGPTPAKPPPDAPTEATAGASLVADVSMLLASPTGYKQPPGGGLISEGDIVVGSPWAPLELRPVPSPLRQPFQELAVGSHHHRQHHHRFSLALPTSPLIKARQPMRRASAGAQQGAGGEPPESGARRGWEGNVGENAPGSSSCLLQELAPAGTPLRARLAEDRARGGKLGPCGSAEKPRPIYGGAATARTRGAGASPAAAVKSPGRAAKAATGGMGGPSPARGAGVPLSPGLLVRPGGMNVARKQARFRLLAAEAVRCQELHSPALPPTDGGGGVAAAQPLGAGEEAQDPWATSLGPTEAAEAAKRREAAEKLLQLGAPVMGPLPPGLLQGLHGQREGPTALGGSAGARPGLAEGDGEHRGSLVPVGFTGVGAADVSDVLLGSSWTEWQQREREVAGAGKAGPMSPVACFGGVDLVLGCEALLGVPMQSVRPGPVAAAASMELGHSSGREALATTAAPEQGQPCQWPTDEAAACSAQPAARKTRRPAVQALAAAGARAQARGGVKARAVHGGRGKGAAGTGGRQAAAAGRRAVGQRRVREASEEEEEEGRGVESVRAMEDGAGGAKVADGQAGGRALGTKRPSRAAAVQAASRLAAAAAARDGQDRKEDACSSGSEDEGGCEGGWEERGCGDASPCPSSCSDEGYGSDGSGWEGEGQALQQRDGRSAAAAGSKGRKRKVGAGAEGSAAGAATAAQAPQEEGAAPAHKKSRLTAPRPPRAAARAPPKSRAAPRQARTAPQRRPGLLAAGVKPPLGGGSSGGAAAAAAGASGAGPSHPGIGAGSGRGAAAPSSSAGVLGKGVKRPAPSKGPIMGLAAGPGSVVAAANKKRRTGAAGGPQRQNFVRTQNGAQRKHSFQFQSKSATSGSIKSAAGSRLRRIKGGGFARASFKARAVAGQGADFVEGFKSEKRCFRCSGTGHWARDCPHANGTAQDVPQEGEGLAPEQGLGGGDAEVVARQVAKEAKDKETAEGTQPGKEGERRGEAGPQPGPKQQQPLQHQERERAVPQEPFELSKLLPEGTTDPLPEDPAATSDDQLRAVLRAVFGHADFRGRQLEVVRSVLRGSPLLAILPTGAGKSLCYQLPALLLPGLVLVVSPLLALMRDQLDRLPPGLPGAMLWGGQTRAEAEAVIAGASSGAIKLLYVAPEKLLTPVVLQALLRMPLGISLVCVDEAHCVAEWGHSFRPAYFRLGHVLRSVLKPRGILALTATATRPTEKCIAQVLGLPEDGIVRDAPMRSNLRLKVLHCNGASTSGRALRSLTQLLREGELKDCRSVVVYCAYQAQADDAAQTLVRAGVHAAAYHAGKHMDERLRVQRAFAKGNLRVVVATVAFGMGVDVACLGAVVHLTMPRSLEDYVQQVGRAGRDGSESMCWLVLDDADHERLRSLSSSNACEEVAVLAFLRKVFAPQHQREREEAESSGGAAGTPGPAFGLQPVQEGALEMDIGEEAMETVLSYLQGHDGRGHIAVLPSTSSSLAVTFHVSPQALAGRSPVAAALLACKARVYSGVHRVQMETLVRHAGRSPSQLLAELSALASSHAIHFELSKGRALAWRVLRAPPESAIPALAAELHGRLARQAALNVRRLDVVHAVMAAAARVPGGPGAQEAELRRRVHDYFNADLDVPSLPDDAPEPPVRAPPADRAGPEVAAFLRTCRDAVLGLQHNMSGVAVARIFHGLSSPAYPADQWRRTGFWGKYTKWDFAALAQLAAGELNKFYLRNGRAH